MAILKVPIELEPMFKADPENFIRDIANFPQDSISRFFKDTLKVFRSVKRSRINPFDFKTHEIDSTFKATDDFRRFMHFDLSLGGDLCSFAMGHTKSFKQVSSIENGKLITLSLPIIYIDLIGIFLVGKREEVWLPEVPKVINKLSNLGFNINLITFDRFQSAYIMQELRGQGFITSLLSIDRTSNYPILDANREDKITKKSTEGNYIAAMSSLKDAVNQERINIPFHPNITPNSTESEFETEAKSAEFYPGKKKVDHPSTGRLDVLQAVAGVCFNIENNVRDFKEDSNNIMKDTEDKFYHQLEQLKEDFGQPRLEIHNESFLG